METFITRYRNVTILVAVLFAQVLGLAMQVKRNADNEPTRLIRIWAVTAVTPFEKAIVWFQHSTFGVWHNYLYLRGVRQENRDLKAEIQRLRIAQVRLSEDAEQARRLQVLLGFKEQFISRTVPAQVIGSSGSEQSRSVYIDKGAAAGLKPDMAVITADGVVGKVLRVINDSVAQVLLIDDQTSGVGAILEKSRLQGVLRGSPSGEVVLEKVMADEQVPAGERVLTSGGDRIFPKGLPVGTVTKVSSGSDFFLSIRVKPAANLSKLEEVLVVTSVEDKEPEVEVTGPMRAADVLAQRLPTVPPKPADSSAKAAGTAATGAPSPGAAKPPKPDAAWAAPKPGAAGNSIQAGSAPPKAPAGNSGITEQAVTPAKPHSPESGIKDVPNGSAQKPVSATTAPKTGSAMESKPSPSPSQVAPASGAALKPATEQKPVPPAIKVAEPLKQVPNGVKAVEPPKTKPQEPPQAPPPEDKPH